MNIGDFGMDTITLAGGLESKLAAMRDAGFTQVMLSARDVAGHPGGVEGAAAAVRASGLAVTGFQVLRDFEGLDGHLHGYKIDVAKAMLETCRAVDAPLLLVCSSTSKHATADRDALARDLAKLAMLAVPLGLRVAYEALSWGRHVNEFDASWDVVQRADCANLGIGLDSFHVFAAGTSLDRLADIDPDKIFLVQLADFMFNELPSFDDRITTARHFRVFPGEGVHSEALADLVRHLDEAGYRGDYSFEVFNDDYAQMPLPNVTRRARASAAWLAQQVLRRSLPLTDRAAPPAAARAAGSAR
jgi:sugar phosphate isomerase/epimerase